MQANLKITRELDHMLMTVSLSFYIVGLRGVEKQDCEKVENDSNHSVNSE